MSGETNDALFAGLGDEELRQELQKHGMNVGPVTPSTRRIYEMKLMKFVQNSGSNGVAQFAERVSTPQKQNGPNGDSNGLNRVHEKRIGNSAQRTDEEIVAAVTEISSDVESEPEMMEVAEIVPTFEEASAAIRTLQKFVLHKSGDANILRKCDEIENFVETERKKNQKQSRIDQFFH
ncbi:LEM domain-containing protein [Ditylenchus destructor]|nr:LEM domain-containing protein [Ditylenchus destructor]